MLQFFSGKKEKSETDIKIHKKLDGVQKMTNMRSEDNRTGSKQKMTKRHQISSTG
jgi:hypothetical protein